MSNDTVGVVLMPFGKHKGRPLGEVPTGYLRWALAEAKLSAGLRGAVRAELSRRGIGLPPEPGPAPRPRSRCRRCGGYAVVATWHEQRGGRKAIRASCSACGGFRGFLPLTPENVAEADAALSPTGLLDALLLADREGVELVAAAGRVEVRPRERASPRLQELVRQSQHALLRHLPAGRA